MNIIQWASEHLDYRCIVYKTFLNIAGETEQVHISLGPKSANGIHTRKVLIEREDKSVLEVYLRDIDLLSDSLYYFEQENGIGATLLIPLPEEEDNGC